MKKLWTWVLVVMLTMPSLASAAYLDQGEILRYEQDQNGAARWIIRFTGTGSEPIVDRPYNIASIPGTTPAQYLLLLREWIRGVVNELNLARTAGVHPAVASGTILHGATASAPTPTAKSVWRGKVSIFGQACAYGFTGAIATDCTALKADIESTYQAGFLNAN